MRKKLLLAGAVLLGVLVLAPLAWVALTEYRPAPDEEVPVTCEGDALTLRVGQPFGLLSWNLQFAGSRKHHFFYDGGKAVHVPRADVEETIRAISRVLGGQRADLVLFQEVDRDSARTNRMDQLPALLSATRAACTATAPYFRSPYVPAPSFEPLGRVDMHLAILSRFPMQAAHRIALPLLDESRLRQAFNLKRALLTAQVPVQGLDQPLAVATTHLSAFSHGDGTLAQQVALLDEWMSSRPAGQPWILAGDLNLLPPGDDPDRLGADHALYADAQNPLATLLPKHRTLFPDPLAPGTRTYLSWGASEPDRKLDYVFIGGPLQIAEARVLFEAADISDHLPVAARLVIQPD